MAGVDDLEEEFVWKQSEYVPVLEHLRLVPLEERHSGTYPSVGRSTDLCESVKKIAYEKIMNIISNKVMK